MQKFQIETQIYQQCDTQLTFEQLDNFFKADSQSKVTNKISHRDFIQYDQEFQFITYTLKRDLHYSLEEVFIYSKQKNFKMYVDQSITLLKKKDTQLKKYKLSIQSLDSQKIWLEIDKKDVIDVLILNYVPNEQNGKNIADVENYLQFLLRIKIDSKDSKSQMKDLIQRIKLENEDQQLKSYPIKILNYYNINKRLNSFYLGLENKEYETKDPIKNFVFIRNQSKQCIDKIIENLQLIKDQIDHQKLLDKLVSFSQEEKLEFIITKIIQKYNLFDELLLDEKFKHNYQITIFFKQYLREQIYECILNQKQQKIPYNQIMIYLIMLNYKKSRADLEDQIKQMFTYTHERLAIFKYQWSSKIISDQEILDIFLIEQTKILQSKKYKIINKNLFVQNIMQSQIYKKRLSDLEQGFQTLRLHFQIELPKLAEDYFKLYYKYLMQDQNKQVNIDEIMSKIFLEIVNLQIKNIINTEP